MKFQKFGQETESNIFHQLDEKKQQLSARGVDGCPWDAGRFASRAKAGEL